MYIYISIYSYNLDILADFIQQNNNVFKQGKKSQVEEPSNNSCVPLKRDDIKVSIKYFW